MINNLYYNTKITNDILLVKNIAILLSKKHRMRAIKIKMLTPFARELKQLSPFLPVLSDHKLVCKNLYICLRLSNQTIFPFNKKAATKNL